MSNSHSHKNGWFDIEDGGFIRQQAGRDPVEIVREVVQNAMDSPDSGRIDIRVVTEGNDTVVEVEDDGSGFTNPSLVFTVFLSGKHDDPTKRGRKGRGLKEAIAPCRRASIEVVGKTVVFDTGSDGRSRQEVANNRKRGTKVRLVIDRWDAAEVDRIVDSIARFEPPAQVTMYLNRKRIVRHREVERVPVRLQTIIIEDEVERKRTRDTEAALLQPRQGETPHIYEMGIPVCQVDTPWHLDIQQRVPLPDHRSTVPQAWLKKLLTQVLDQMAEFMTDAELKDDWVGGVLDRTDDATQKTYVDTVFGSNVAIFTPGNSEANVMADEDLGFNVIQTGHLPTGVRKAVRNHAPSTRKVVKDAWTDTVAAQGDWSPGADDDTPTPKPKFVPTEHEQAVCRLAAWIATEVTGRAVQGQVRPSVEGFGRRMAMAAWSPSEGTILFSRSGCGAGFFRVPLSATVLSVICHEVAHIDQSDPGHGKAFCNELERISGRVAKLLLDRGDEAKALVNGVP